MGDSFRGAGGSEGSRIATVHSLTEARVLESTKMAEKMAGHRVWKCGREMKPLLRGWQRLLASGDSAQLKGNELQKNEGGREKRKDGWGWLWGLGLPAP
jgi:hypothetical protein